MTLCHTWQEKGGHTFGGVLIYHSSSSMTQPALLPYNLSAFSVLLPSFTAACFLHTPQAKMASGVEICDDVKEMIAKMKVVKSGDDQNDRVRLAIFCIRDSKEIIVAKTFNQKDVGDSPVFSIITDEMKENPCFYALYDCNFQTKDNVDKDDLIFITWTSDCASIKNKMIYASSKENLKGCMKGVKHHMQLNDHSDWSRQALADKIQDKSTWRVAKVEKVDI